MQKQRVKTSMSVPEMGKMLGLGKVESYWLVKKNYFKTIQVAGRMRVMLDSFEDWYAGQFHYKKSGWYTARREMEAYYDVSSGNGGSFGAEIWHSL